MTGNHLQNEHVFVFFRFRAWLSKISKNWISKEFYEHWAELERKNQVKTERGDKM